MDTGVIFCYFYKSGGSKLAICRNRRLLPASGHANGWPAHIMWYAIFFRSIFLYLAYNFLIQRADTFILDAATPSLVPQARQALSSCEPFVYQYGGIVGASRPFHLCFQCDILPKATHPYPYHMITLNRRRNRFSDYRLGESGKKPNMARTSTGCMGKRGEIVQINASVLRWIISGSGWTAQEISENAGISIEDIHRWVKYDSTIRVQDLQTIAKIIKRPLTVFLLPEPPKENDLTDYRRVGGGGTGKLSKKMLGVIREARHYQFVAAELLDMLSEDALPKIIPRTIQDDPQVVAEVEKKSLGLDLEKRPKEKNMYAFAQDKYLALKVNIELLNIFVLQMSMDISEARGFTLPDGYPKVILINSKDDPRPKLFTLLHEYAHLLLKTDGICPADSFYSGLQHADTDAWLLDNFL